MPTGVVTLKINPLASNFSCPIRTDEPAAALRLDFHSGGRSLSDRDQDAIINFYKDPNEKPHYSFKWKELQDAYKTTKCSSDNVKALDGNPDGKAMICDQSLDLSDITYIEFEEKPGKTKSATSWVSYFMNSQVKAVDINFY